MRLSKLNGHYLDVAKELLRQSKLKTKGVKVTADDVAVFLMLFRFFRLNPNPDGSQPMDKFGGTRWRKVDGVWQWVEVGFWKDLYDAGATTRANASNLL